MNPSPFSYMLFFDYKKYRTWIFFDRNEVNDKKSYIWHSRKFWSRSIEGESVKKENAENRERGGKKKIAILVHVKSLN